MKKAVIINILVLYSFTSIQYLVAQDWLPLNNNYLNPSSISTIFIDSSSGNIYVGGTFNNNFGIQGIAVWNGNQWDSMGPGLYNDPWQIGKFNNEIIVAGAFSELPSGYNYDNIVKWNGNGWESLGGGANNAVTGFYQYNNELIVHGLFDSVGDIAASMIARWDGQNWHAFDTTKWEGYTIMDVEVFNGEIYAGGNFFNYDYSIGYLARWDGNKWNAVDNNILYANSIYDMEVYNNELYIAKAYNTFSSYLVKWDGQTWTNIGNNYINNIVRVLYEFNNKLYIGGWFYNTQIADTIASLLKWDGNSLCKFNDKILYGVESISSKDSSLIIGGEFNIENGQINCLAMANGYLAVDTCFYILNSINDLDTFSIHLYPNPTSNLITINYLTASQSAFIEIYNSLGLLIRKKQFYNRDHNIISMDTLEKGLYYFKIHDGNKCIVKKVIKI